MSLAGGFPSTPPVKVSGVETDVRGWVGGSTSLVRGGRESSFNRLDVFGLGLEGLCCGPIGLDLGEAQGPFNEIQVDLGCVSRPNDLNGFKRYNKGMWVVGLLKLTQREKGLFLGTRLQSLYLGHKVNLQSSKKEAQMETMTLLSGCR